MRMIVPKISKLKFLFFKKGLCVKGWRVYCGVPRGMCCRVSGHFSWNKFWPIQLFWGSFVTCLPKCFITLFTVWLNDSFPGLNYVFKEIPMIPSTGWTFYVQVSRYFQGNILVFSPEKKTFCVGSPPPPNDGGQQVFPGILYKSRVWHSDLCFGHFITLLCGKWTVGGALSIKPDKKKAKESPVLGMGMSFTSLSDF